MSKQSKSPIEEPIMPSFREFLTDPDWKHKTYFKGLFDKDKEGKKLETKTNKLLNAKLTKLIEEQKNYKGVFTTNTNIGGIIIAIDGAHGNGKSTFTKIFKDIFKKNKQKVFIASFCSALKRMLNTGNLIPEVYGTDAEKREPVEHVFDNNTARDLMRYFGQSIQELAMQKDGTEYIWCRYMFEFICKNWNQIIIIDDAYLPHWRETLRQTSKRLNMRLINLKITRNGKKKDGSHVTQMANEDDDYHELTNNGTLEEFEDKIRDFADELMF